MRGRTFETLKRHLYLSYGCQDPRRDALKALTTISQKPSETVAQYYQRFMQALPDLTFGGKDASLSDLWQVHFFKGLLPSLREKVAIHAATVNEFVKLEDIYTVALSRS